MIAQQIPPSVTTPPVTERRKRITWSDLTSARFMEKVTSLPVPAEVPPDSPAWMRYPCWPWMAGTNRDGYGMFSLNGSNVSAHRFSYELFVGPIPEGKHLDHLCRFRGCEQPMHLEPVTNRENVLRGNGFPAQNARRTHCRKGHPFEDSNVYLYKGSARRFCLECRKQNYTRLREGVPSGANADKTHCAKGHEYSPENTRILHDGGRECRQCKRAWDLAFRLKRKTRGLMAKFDGAVANA